MKTAIIQVPGLNRDQDMVYALKSITNKEPIKIWASDSTIPNVDLIVIPGGFSYGDYLRCGAIAALSPALKAVKEQADRGVLIMGVCNGFQILLESGLLPGALLPNQSLKFICKVINLEVVNNKSQFSHLYQNKQIISCPIAHHDGNYYADEDTLKELEDNNQVIFRYLDDQNPNGSCHHIAGIINKDGNIMGMMPHPENFIETEQGGTDGSLIFKSALNLSL